MLTIKSCRNIIFKGMVITHHTLPVPSSLRFLAAFFTFSGIKYDTDFLKVSKGVKLRKKKSIEVVANNKSLKKGMTDIKK
jgi:hypothetical protein